MTQPTSGAIASPAQKTVAQMLGEVVWLMTQSPVHRQMFIGDLEWFCLPALLLEQYRIFYGPDAPAAVAFWAAVSEETEARLIEGGSRLQPGEWARGDRLWLVELVAPFGGQDEILKDLAASVFAGKSFKFHRLAVDGAREVATWPQAATPNQLGEL